MQIQPRFHSKTKNPNTLKEEIGATLEKLIQSKIATTAFSIRNKYKNNKTKMVQTDSLIPKKNLQEHLDLLNKTIADVSQKYELYFKINANLMKQINLITDENKTLINNNQNLLQQIADFQLKLVDRDHLQIQLDHLETLLKDKDQRIAQFVLLHKSSMDKIIQLSNQMQSDQIKTTALDNAELTTLQNAPEIHKNNSQPEACILTSNRCEIGSALTSHVQERHIILALGDPTKLKEDKTSQNLTNCVVGETSVDELIGEKVENMTTQKVNPWPLGIWSPFQPMSAKPKISDFRFGAKEKRRNHFIKQPPNKKRKDEKYHQMTLPFCQQSTPEADNSEHEQRTNPTQQHILKLPVLRKVQISPSPNTLKVFQEALGKLCLEVDDWSKNSVETNNILNGLIQKLAGDTGKQQKRKIEKQIHKNLEKHRKLAWTGESLQNQLIKIKIKSQEFTNLDNFSSLEVGRQISEKLSQIKSGMSDLKATKSNLKKWL